MANWPFHPWILASLLKPINRKVFPSNKEIEIKESKIKTKQSKKQVKTELMVHNLRQTNLLKLLRQIWDISQGVYSREVYFRRKFWLSMTSSLIVRVIILSREVEYLFWVWMHSAKSCKRQYYWYFCKQAINKLLSGCGFRKVFVIDQNLKYIYVSYFFMNFWSSSD